MANSIPLSRPAAGEPDPAKLRNPALRYFLATRPAFLGITGCAVAIGLGVAACDGVAMMWLPAAVSGAFALVAHAGVNVLNDYYDELGGSDRGNDDRVFPYTGGSRFIQNGVMGNEETLVLGLALFAAVIAAGLWLTARSGPGLVLIGGLGLLVGWAYSAPPLALCSRALGEPAAAIGMGLIVAGTDYVQRGSLTIHPWIVALPFALLAANILLVNEFPDYRADLAAGKRQWVVRLGPRRARWACLALVLTAYLWLLAVVALGALPPTLLLALLALPWSLAGVRGVLREAERPQALRPAIQATIAAALLAGALSAAGLFLAAAGRP